MTLPEMSIQFDILYNNITSNQAPGLNEFEKSVFLTKAQSQLVKEYFNSRTDAVGGGFDGSQKRQYDFSSLIRVENLFNVNTYANRIENNEKLDSRSYVFLYPDNYFLIINEIVRDSKGQYSVIPINYAEYQRLMMKPYAYPVKRAAWRLITDKKNCNYWRRYAKESDGDLGDEGTRETETDYRFTSGWADQKRNLSIEINISNDDNPYFPSGEYPQIGKIDSDKYNAIFLDYKVDSLHAHYMMVSGKWNDDEDDNEPGTTYEVEITVDNTFAEENADDETILDFIKECFEAARNKVGIHVPTDDSKVAKVCRHTDGFAMATAPSHYYNIKAGNLQFTTDVIQLPFAEVIGKFNGTPQYQVRYVRTLEPIILEDLSSYGDVTIGGLQKAMECKLPAECHDEIIERAVALAKIAWQGGITAQQ